MGSAEKWLREEAEWCRRQLQENDKKFDCNCWIVHVQKCEHYRKEEDARE